jgi:uncharacterized Zn finger protein (UPF0148 family)
MYSNSRELDAFVVNTTNEIEKDLNLLYEKYGKGNVICPCCGEQITIVELFSLIEEAYFAGSNRASSVISDKIISEPDEHVCDEETIKEV